MTVKVGNSQQHSHSSLHALQQSLFKSFDRASSGGAKASIEAVLQAGTTDAESSGGSSKHFANMFGSDSAGGPTVPVDATPHKPPGTSRSSGTRSGKAFSVNVVWLMLCMSQHVCFCCHFEQVAAYHRPRPKVLAVILLAVLVVALVVMPTRRVLAGRKRIGLTSCRSWSHNVVHPATRIRRGGALTQRHSSRI